MVIKICKAHSIFTVMENNKRRRRVIMLQPVLLFGAASVLLSCTTPSVEGFSASTPIFSPKGTTSRTAPSKTQGVAIELPNFDELFERVGKVSPLARLAIERKEGGFSAIDDKADPLKWRSVESNKKRIVHKIDKIDNFMNLGWPMLRFRASLKGPCISERFANFIMDLDERKKWDNQIAAVDELYPIKDLDAANIAIGPKFGDCGRLGVGYCATKPNFITDGREQLTLCGLQEFVDGSSIIWGTEMEDRHNHLFPPGDRISRARTLLFATALMPTGPDSFDAEYVLQMDVGRIPAFLSTPVLMDTVKSLFKRANEYFGGGDDSEIARYISSQQNMDDNVELMTERKSILLAH